MSKVRGKNARGVRTHQQLLQAAGREFADRGYAATRISDIAERAGVSTGNFYRHFASKPEIFIEVLRPALDSLFASSQGVDPSPEPGINHEALFAAHLGFFREYAKNRQLFRSLFEAAAAREDPSVTRTWMEIRGRFIDRTTIWLMALHERGQAGDGDFAMLADALCSGAEQLAHVHLGLQESEPDAARVRRMSSAVTELWIAAIPEPKGASPHAGRSAGGPMRTTGMAEGSAISGHIADDDNAVSADAAIRRPGRRAGDTP